MKPNGPYGELVKLRDAGELPPIMGDIFMTPRPAVELFDYLADPHCTTNLADEPAHAEAQRALRAQLDQWQADTDDAFPGEGQLKADVIDRTTGERLARGDDADDDASDEE